MLQDDKIKIKNIKRYEASHNVYNFGTMDDESYVVEGIFCHNCNGFNIPILSSEPTIGAQAKPLPKSITDRFKTINGVPVRNSFTQFKATQQIPVLKSSYAYRQFEKGVTIGNRKLIGGKLVTPTMEIKQKILANSIPKVNILDISDYIKQYETGGVTKKAFSERMNVLFKNPKLDVRDRQLIRAFMSNDFEINDKLRKGVKLNATEKLMHESLVKAINKSKIGAEVSLYRGGEYTDNFIKTNFKKGAVFTDKGVSFVSPVSDYAKMYGEGNTIFKIETPKGAKVFNLGNVADKAKYGDFFYKECVMQNNKFKVLEVKKNFQGASNYIILELIK